MNKRIIVLAAAIAIVLVAGCATNNKSNIKDDYPQKTARQPNINEVGKEKKNEEVSLMGSFSVKTPAFEHGRKIPSKYTCDGDDVSPELRISNIPQGTKTLALIVDDPDAPMGTWVHWVVWNIPPTEVIAEDTAPGTQGINDFQKHEWGGPCPPSGEHRYFFKVYALDTELDIGEDSRKEDVERAMEGHILAKAELMGTYSRE